ncbi:SHOCT domain-containing protein [Dehalococcoides sp. THU3]|uniref:SHOCT domain-containing protein n=1 Tax=Dehalococcoides TaxID=61434 RepID=UPI003218C5FB
MTKEEALLHYKAAMAVFKNWLAEGAISNADLLEIDTMLARKYGLSSCSIYLENDLLCKENRVIYGTVKGGQYGQNNN